MINRLINFYRRYSVDVSLHEIWSRVTSSWQLPLITALKNGDEPGVKRILDSAGTSEIILGLDQPNVLQFHSIEALDKISLLAQRIGVLPCENPEQPIADSMPLVTLDNYEEVIRKIEEVLPVKFVCPDAVGYKCFGANSGFPNRFPNYCSALYSISLCTNNAAPSKVLEIGAGIGLLAMLCYRWGVKSYSIIDIPSTAVISAYALSQVCGADAVWLEGEEWNPNAYARIYPSTDYGRIACSNYDVVFNSDSFPEIPIEQQDKYLELIATHLTADGFFLSINHESTSYSQRRVYDAVMAQGALTLKQRAPFMLRAGYQEEIYSL